MRTRILRALPFSFVSADSLIARGLGTSVLGVPLLSLASLFIVGWFGEIVHGQTPLPQSSAPSSQSAVPKLRANIDRLFNPSRLIEVKIDMAPSDWDKLDDYQGDEEDEDDWETGDDEDW